MIQLDRAPVTSIEVATFTRRDPILSEVMDYVMCGWPEDFSADEMVQPFERRRDELSVDQGCLLWGSRVIIPKRLRSDTLKELHQTHIGMSRMKMLARCFCWWPKMDQDIEQAVRDCEICQRNQKEPAKAPIHPWETTSEPWVRLHLDYAGPFLGKMFLIVTDTYSKWIDAFILPTASSKNTIEKLRCSFATHGIPRFLVSDNASYFTSEEFRNFASKNGIVLINSAPYHPSSNGAAERAVQTFKSTLKKLKRENSDSLETQVNRMLFAYRNTPHSVTGLSPAEILMKRRPRTCLSLLKPGNEQRDKSQRAMEESRSPRKLRELETGACVNVRNYSTGDKWLPGQILSRTGPVSYKVRVQGGTVKRHLDQILPRSEPY